MVCLGVEFHNNNRNCFLRMQVVIKCVLFCGLTADWSSNQQLHHTALLHQKLCTSNRGNPSDGQILLLGLKLLTNTLSPR